MKASELSKSQRRYNEESSFLDQMYEFHRRFFQQLTNDDYQLLSDYYLFDKKPPEDIFERQAQMKKDNPEAVAQAEAAFKRFTVSMGLDSFTYQ